MANRFYNLYNKVNKKRYEEDAFNTLIKNLLSNDISGKDKMQTIVSHDMEKNSPTDFIPSMFYIFMYAKNEKENVGNMQFYDMCPLILCTGSDVLTVTGINFNFIPNDVRAAVLDILTGDFQNFYDDVEYNGKDDLIVNETLGSMLITEKGVSGVIQYIQAKTNIDIKSCIRTYNKHNILKSRLIEYDQWIHIPFLSFRDAVRGINLAKLQMNMVSGTASYTDK